jgi:hypothetical protein
MTAIEFNNKWSDYLAEGHYGADIHDSDVLDLVDREFEKKVETFPNFKYYQMLS